jgi:predicted dehydrogenase
MRKEDFMPMQTAILGFAHGHVSSYCEEWLKRPELGITVTAGYDHDAGRLDNAVKAFGLRPFTDPDTLLSQAEIEAVIIGSETSMHADLVERAAAAGKAIVLQKPIALNMQEADRIVYAVKRYKVPFTMAWQMRVDPQNEQMKLWIESGRLGNVFMVRRKHGLGMGLSPDFADSWHVDPKYNRDIWADDASHPIDFIHWLLGVPATVTAEIESLYNPRIPLDNGIALFRYADGGPLAEVCCSFTCSAGENTTEIIGEKGVIIQNYGDNPSCNAPRPADAPGLKLYSSESKSWTYSEHASPANHGQRIRGLAEPLAEFLQGRRGPIASSEEGRTSLRMLLASCVSARDGRRVSMIDGDIGSA